MKNFQLNIYWCLISFSGWCRSRTGYRWTDRRRPIAEPLLRLRPFLLGLRLQTVAIVRHQRYQEPRKASLKTTSTTENETICFCGAENWKKNKSFGEKQTKIHLFIQPWILTVKSRIWLRILPFLSIHNIPKFGTFAVDN